MANSIKVAAIVGTVLVAGVACQNSEPERSAGFFYNEMRICVQNQTSQTIDEVVEVANDGTLVNDSGARQDSFSVGLGPQALACHTTSSNIQIPAILLQLDAGSGPSNVVTISNSNSGFRVIVGEDTSLEGAYTGKLNKQEVDVTEGKTFTFQLDQLPGMTIVGYISGDLRSFPNGLKAYQMDLRIIPS